MIPADTSLTINLRTAPETPIYASDLLTVQECAQINRRYGIPTVVSGTLTAWVHQTYPENLTSVARGSGF